jgi:hypothetical protein
MIRNLAVVLFGLSGVGATLFAQQEFKQTQVTSTERLDFAPGGTIRCSNSYGDLRVEAWDRPEVEMTVTKSLQRFGVSKTQDQDARRMESIHVSMDRKSPGELTISTMLASRHGDWAPPLPRNTTAGVAMEYEIHVPRDSRLAIQHHTGSVSVTGVTGDIDASVGRGDLLLWLAPGTYSIDAKTKLGNISSEFEGDAISQYLVGQHFTRVSAAPSRKLHLRMGFGGIAIQEILPESDAPAAVKTE